MKTKPEVESFPRRFLSPEPNAEPIYHDDPRYSYASYEEVIVEDSVSNRLRTKPYEVEANPYV